MIGAAEARDYVTCHVARVTIAPVFEMFLHSHTWFELFTVTQNFHTSSYSHYLLTVVGCRAFSCLCTLYVIQVSRIYSTCYYSHRTFDFFTVYANIEQLMSNHFIIYYSMHIDRYCQPKTVTRVVGQQPNLHYNVVELFQLLRLTFSIVIQ